MDVNEALKFLEESKQQNTYSVVIPTLNEEFKFEQISAGDQRNLTETAIKDENEFYVTLTKTIAKLCKDRLPFTQLTDRDRCAILYQIKVKNNAGLKEAPLKCEKCEHEQKHKIDLTEMLADLLKPETTGKYTCAEAFDVKYDFLLDLPTIDKQLEYKSIIDAKRKMIEGTKISDKEQQTMMINLLTKLELEYVILFIREISINKNKIEGFYDLPFEQKSKFIGNIPKDVIYGETGIFSEMETHFLPITTSFSYEINDQCEECNADLNERIPVEAFFYA